MMNCINWISETLSHYEYCLLILFQEKCSSCLDLVFSANKGDDLRIFIKPLLLRSASQATPQGRRRTHATGGKVGFELATNGIKLCDVPTRPSHPSICLCLFVPECGWVSGWGVGQPSRQRATRVDPYGGVIQCMFVRLCVRVSGMVTLGVIRIVCARLHEVESL